jgi:hypothetical protein
LNQNEQGALQKSAIGITTGYVAGRIANSLFEALGLERLGVDIREINFSGGQVGFGRYLGSNRNSSPASMAAKSKWNTKSSLIGNSAARPAAPDRKASI